MIWDLCLIFFLGTNFILFFRAVQFLSTILFTINFLHLMGTTLVTTIGIVSKLGVQPGAQTLTPWVHQRSVEFTLLYLFGVGNGCGPFQWALRYGASLVFRSCFTSPVTVFVRVMRDHGIGVEANKIGRAL